MLRRLSTQGLRGRILGRGPVERAGEQRPKHWPRLFLKNNANASDASTVTRPPSSFEGSMRLITEETHEAALAFSAGVVGRAGLVT